MDSPKLRKSCLEYLGSRFNRWIQIMEVKDYSAPKMGGPIMRKKLVNKNPTVIAANLHFAKE